MFPKKAEIIYIVPCNKMILIWTRWKTIQIPRRLILNIVLISFCTRNLVFYYYYYLCVNVMEISATTLRISNYMKIWQVLSWMSQFWLACLINILCSVLMKQSVTKCRYYFSKTLVLIKTLKTFWNLGIISFTVTSFWHYVFGSHFRSFNISWHWEDIFKCFLRIKCKVSLTTLFHYINIFGTSLELIDFEI